MLKGGCFCGRLRYEIRGAPYHRTICHCVDCRRISGAPMVAWFSLRPTDLVFVSGTPNTFMSSEGVTRGFCGHCGTPLTYARADLPDEIDVTTATLDLPGRVTPEDQTFVRDRLAWIETIATLPAHVGSRPG